MWVDEDDKGFKRDEKFSESFLFLAMKKI